jgi:hypothetical protein
MANQPKKPTKGKIKVKDLKPVKNAKGGCASGQHFPKST